MTRVLSIEHVFSGSWGLVFAALRRAMSDKYKVVRMTRKLKREIPKKIIGLYPITLVQNVENIRLIPYYRERLAVRMGGMAIDRANRGSRYDAHLAQVGAVIATNKQLYDIAAKVNGNVHLVPNGVDLEVFKPPEKVLERPFTIGFAGNIWGYGGNYKGWQFYVGAALSLMRHGVRRRECLLHGPESQKQIKHADMPKEFYHKIDCLIMPSRGEGCSNVVGEALACGVPVLLTKVGYHGEMLKDGHNCLFIKRHVEDIYNKVLRLKDDPGLRARLSKNGRKFVEENQNVKEIAAKYDIVFQSMLNKDV